MTQLFYKDPSAELDYVFDWSDWLETDEIINSFIITAATGITVDDYGEDSGVITVWLTGGTALHNYSVACLIVTNLGRTDERTIDISCINR